VPLIHLKNQNNGSKIKAEGRNNKIEIEKVLLSCNPGTNLKIISSNIWSDLDLKRGRKKLQNCTRLKLSVNYTQIIIRGLFACREGAKK